MTAAFLAALGLSLAVRLWLAQRQLRHVAAHRDAVPEAFRESVPLDAHRKAADYTVMRVRFGRWTLLARAALLLAWTLGGGLRALRGAWALETLPGATGFVLSALMLTELCMLPFAAWSTFFIEQRFGFNRTTPATFVSDLVKSSLVFVVLGGAVAGGMIALIRGGGVWWPLYAWAGWFGFVWLMNWAVPTLIAPLFQKFRPLPDGELKARLERLLARVDFRSRGLFVVDGSRRSTHANAYFTGLGRRKRIVLFDTLCEQLAPDEIESVLAHELGHFRMHHVRNGLAVSALVTLAALFALQAVATAPWFHDALGLGGAPPSVPAGLVLFAWVAPLFVFPLRPLVNAWSRKRELEADAFAANQTSPAAMASALVTLARQNATTLTPDPLHAKWHNSHPPPAERIRKVSDTC